MMLNASKAFDRDEYTTLSYFFVIRRLYPDVHKLLKAQLGQLNVSLKIIYFVQTVLGNKNELHIELKSFAIIAQHNQPFSSLILFVYLPTHR